MNLDKKLTKILKDTNCEDYGVYPELIEEIKQLFRELVEEQKIDIGDGDNCKNCGILLISGDCCCEVINDTLDNLLSALEKGKD